MVEVAADGATLPTSVSRFSRTVRYVFEVSPGPRLTSLLLGLRRGQGKIFRSPSHKLVGDYTDSSPHLLPGANESVVGVVHI